MFDGFKRLYCSECGEVVEEYVSFYGIQTEATSIGPPTTACHNCGEEVLNGRSEWCEKTWPAKVRFVAWRVLWAIPSSIAFTAFGIVAWEVFRALFVNRRARVWMGVAVKSWPIIVAAVMIGVVVGMTFRQCLREISQSNRRCDST